MINDGGMVGSANRVYGGIPAAPPPAVPMPGPEMLAAAMEKAKKRRELPAGQAGPPKPGMLSMLLRKFNNGD